MGSRLDLDSELRDFINSENVYFQPPESIKMNYPCIVYKRYSGNTIYANNMPYGYTQAYEVTIIDKNPDSDLVKRMPTRFPMSQYSRHFAFENLNHDVFIVFY